MKNLKIEKPFENWNLMDYFKIKDDEMKSEEKVRGPKGDHAKRYKWESW